MARDYLLYYLELEWVQKAYNERNEESETLSGIPKDMENGNGYEGIGDKVRN